jgi:transposase
MGKLLMSLKERKRLVLLEKVKTGEMTVKKASELCGLSYRQMKRVWKRYRTRGDAGLVHAARGRVSNRACSLEVKKQVLCRYKERYPDFGPTLAAEYLSQEGFEIDHETLRRWLMKEGLWKKRRQRSRHRKWRERKAHCGELIQMDGSHHDWFEGRGPWAVLMVLIDDATNRTFARFFEAETTRAAYESFAAYVRRYGLPQALYVDRDSIYRCEREGRVEEELRGEGPKTNFERAMGRLGVELILANSPQAKGRVERRNGVFQDRLVKAMRLAEVNGIEQANAYLEAGFLTELNRRFRVTAREAGNAHGRLPAGLKLSEVLCWEEDRVVGKDWTVRWRNRFFQISSRHERFNLPGRRLTVRETLKGEVLLIWRGQRLQYRELPARPPRASKALKRANGQAYKPSPDHPWKKAWSRRAPRKAPSATPPGPPGARVEGTLLTS